MRRQNWTERLARTSARRPWTTIGIWAAVLGLSLILITNLLEDSLTSDLLRLDNNPESTQAQTILQDKLGYQDTLDEIIIIQSDTVTVDDPAFREQVQKLSTEISALDKSVVLSSQDYYSTGIASLVSADRHSTLIRLTIPKAAERQIGLVHDVTAKYNRDGSFEVYQTGDASFSKDIDALAEHTLKTGESIGIPVALVVLAIVFGAIVSVFLPLILGVAAIVVALGLVSLVGQAIDLAFLVTNIVAMMGLAIGIDYSLFVLTRYREERARGLDKIEAIAATGATASKAIFFSGITVMLALGGLILFPMPLFQTIGIGAELVVLIAVAAELTLLPAVLSLTGDRVNALRLPFARPAEDEYQNGAQKGFWIWITKIVTRVPVISIILTTLVLGTLAFQYFDMKTGMPGMDGIPDDSPSKVGLRVLQEEFSLGLNDAATIVIEGDLRSESIQTAITSLQTAIASDSFFTGTMLMPYPDKDIAVLYAGITGDPFSEQAMDEVQMLRDKYIPQAFGDEPVRPLLTGSTAAVLDFDQTIHDYTPIIFGFVLLLSFVILTLAFRSIVIPIKAILMNLLSVGAAYGLMVLVFQKGFGDELFGFRQIDMIESWLPIFLFTLLFGLSMDYHVFLLSRIRERFKQTGDNAESVAFGLRSTGKLITGAALIMVAIFGGFALGDMAAFQQMGFGLAVAVLIDATLIRCVLVPAAMKVLGNTNWYLPKWLNWIPDVGL
jgi:RND superfamily putative drug exporter